VSWKPFVKSKPTATTMTSAKRNVLCTHHS
jgi:hypothetical protein